jgi:hypothetical protein
MGEGLKVHSELGDGVSPGEGPRPAKVREPGKEVMPDVMGSGVGEAG